MYYYIFNYDDNLIFDLNIFICQRDRGGCFLGARCVISWSSYGLKLGIPWKFIFHFSLFLLILCLPDVSNNIKSHFLVAGFQPWTCWWFLWTDLSIVGLYILNMSLTWQQISVTYLNFGGRFKSVIQHYVY